MKKKVFLALLAVFLLFGITTVKAVTQNDIDTAIDKGVEWLVNQQNADGPWGSYYPVAQTGLALVVLEDYAAAQGKLPLDNTYDYYENVVKGLNYILSKAYIVDISEEPAGNPDTDGDGKGIYFSSGQDIYETGIAMMAIASSRQPDLATGTGFDFNNDGTDDVTFPVIDADNDGNPDTLNQVLQDAVDYMAYCQNDEGGARGGWRYSCNSGESDNSNSGWATFGLGFAQTPIYGFNITIPQFVKDELSIWINYIQNDVNGDQYDGGSGYTSPNDWVNILKTGHLLYEMYLYGDNMSTQRVKDAIDYIIRNWEESVDPGWNGEPACYHTTFNLVKGIGSFYGADLGSEITSSEGATTIAWFDDIAGVVISQQNDDGSWPGNCNWGNEILCTEWAILTLQKVVPLTFTKTSYLGATAGCIGDEVELRAELLDEDKKPVPGKTIHFALFLGEEVVQEAEADTDASGVASINITIDPDFTDVLPRLFADPDKGDSPLTVNFTASHFKVSARFFGDEEYAGSKDEKDFADMVSQYQWDFDGDNEADKTTEPSGESLGNTTAHTYDIPCPRNYWPRVTLLLCDGETTLSSEPIRITVTVPGPYITNANVNGTDEVIVYFNEPIDINSIDNTDFGLEIPEGTNVKDAGGEIKIKDVCGSCSYVVLKVIGYSWDMDTIGYVWLTDKGAIRNSEGEENNTDSNCKVKVLSSPVKLLGAFDTDEDTQIDHFALYYKGGFSGDPQGFDARITTDRLSGIWGRKYGWNIKGAQLINDNCIFIEVEESGYFNDLNKTPRFHIKVTNFGGLTDSGGNVFDLDEFDFEGGWYGHRYSVVSPEISFARATDNDAVLLRFNTVLDPNSIDVGDFVLEMPEGTDVGKIVISDVWEGYDWRLGRDVTYIELDIDDYEWEETDEGRVKLSDADVVFSHPIPFFGVTFGNAKTDFVKVEALWPMGFFATALDTDDNDVIDTFIIRNPKGFSGNFGEFNATIETYDLADIGKHYIWTTKTPGFRNGNEIIWIPVEESGFEDLETPNFSFHIVVTSNTVTVDGEALSVDVSWAGIAQIEPEDIYISDAWYCWGTNQLHIEFSLPYHWYYHWWGEWVEYSSNLFHVEGKSPSDDFIVSFVKSEWDEEQGKWVETVLKENVINFSGANYEHICGNHVVIQLPEGAIDFPENAVYGQFKIALKEGHGFSYAFLGMILPEISGYIWDLPGEWNQVDTYVMDIKGGVYDENGNPVPNAMVEAWVMKKQPVSILIRYDNIDYNFDLSGSEASFDVYNAIDKSYRTHTNTTLYLQFKKGYPLKISADPLDIQKGGGWKQIPIVFNPIDNTITGEGVSGYVKYFRSPAHRGWHWWCEPQWSEWYYGWTYWPSAWAFTDDNGNYLIHVVNNVSKGDPVIITVGTEKADHFEVVPVTGLAANDQDFYIGFNAIYNEDKGEAYEYNINLGKVHQIVHNPVYHSEDSKWILFSIPVKKAYYTDEAAIPASIPDGWPKVKVDRICDAFVRLAWGPGFGNAPIGGCPPGVLLSIDDKGIHFSGYGIGDVRCLAGGFGYLKGIIFSEFTPILSFVNFSGPYYFGDGLVADDNLSLSAHGPNNGWYIVGNWKGRTVGDATSGDYDNVDYLMTLLDGYRSYDPESEDFSDLSPTENQPVYIIHVTDSINW